MMSPLRISLLALVAISPALANPTEGCQRCLLPLFTSVGTIKWNSATAADYGKTPKGCFTMEPSCGYSSSGVTGIQINGNNGKILPTGLLKLTCSDAGVWETVVNGVKEPVTSATCSVPSKCKDCAPIPGMFDGGSWTMIDKNEVTPDDVCNKMSPVCGSNGVQINGAGKVLKPNDFKLKCGPGGTWEADVEGKITPVSKAKCGVEIPVCQTCDPSRFPLRTGAWASDPTKRGMWVKEFGYEETKMGCKTWSMTCTNTEGGKGYQINMDTTTTFPVDSPLIITCKNASRTGNEWYRKVNNVEERVKNTLCNAETV